MKYLWCLGLLFPVLLMGQDQKNAATLVKKQVSALRISEKPVLDGHLDEAFWHDAAIATDFVVFEPTPGAQPTFRTEVKIVYDDLGIYIGAMLYDTAPDSINKELSQRDNLGNTDWFLVAFDPYQSGINAFEFLVTPTDIQFDAQAGSRGEDTNWDAVWDNRSVILENGWSTEIKIPYSALRFPETDIQTWGFNCIRLLSRLQEKSFWNPLDPQIQGFVPQFGRLTELRNIKSPPRLQATPFLATYVQKYSDPNGENSQAYSINGGMDVKIGLSDAFTLDMTLIPDFGEARSDDQVLNLSPFEVRFDEQRAFFTEGTELFSKANLFYSRRIGGTPLHYGKVRSEYSGDNGEVLSNPSRGQLYNATKITGRTANGLGIGFFNATSGRTFARVRDSEGTEKDILTDPLTNYNVLVFDQNLPNNSSASLINTTVLREGEDYDANVTGAFAQIRDKKNDWQVSGNFILTQLYNPASTDLGHTLSLELDRISGNLRYGVEYSEESDTYDPTDLGFLYNNNSREWSGYVRYQQFEPFGIFNNAGGGIYTEYQRLYQPNAFAQYFVEAFAFGQFKNFWRFNIWSGMTPVDNYDYFEPRTTGRYWRDLPSRNVGFNVRTDQRKQFFTQIRSNFWFSDQEGRSNYSMGIRPRYRFSDQLNVDFNVDYRIGANNTGYVTNYTSTNIDPVTGELFDQHNIIFGIRDRNTLELSMGASYNFNSRMALTMRARHYWSTVDYQDFRLLGEDGTLQPTEYTGEHNNDFDAFNVDVIYRWRFAPGSDIFLVWKNSVFAFDERISKNYWKNWDGLWENPQTNQLSLKIVYFLDYAVLRGRG